MKLLIATYLILVGIAHGADPHKHPQGWNYDPTCCSDRDCRMITNVREGKFGYTVPNGEIIPYRNPRIRDSKDGDFHWCTINGTATGHTLCLYVPVRSF